MHPDLLSLAARVEELTGPSKEVSRPCQWCGSTMRREPHQRPYQWAKQRFCSRECSGHYSNRRFRRTPDEMRQFIIENTEFDQFSHCWNARVHRRQHGYAIAVWNGRKYKLHRLAYELWCGPIDDKNLICHRCDNRRCVNPAHLFQGTNADNIADRDRKGRQASGERLGRAKLKEKQVREILASDEPHTVLAARYGVGPTAIFNIRRGVTWKGIAALRAKAAQQQMEADR